MSNKELWDRVKVTNPAAVKPITGKPYKGNSPKPFWLIERATDEFGPCGIGWGVQIESERFERLTETDVLHVAQVHVWYVIDGKRGMISQMGQTKAVYKTNAGALMVDEDAPKKSVTDGMVKCLSMLGFAGDIFSGMWDDSKYVEWAAEQYQPKPERMSETSIADHKAVFDGCTTPAALKEAGNLACSIADAMGDTDARAVLGAAYAARKKKLSQQKETA